VPPTASRGAGIPPNLASGPENRGGSQVGFREPRRFFSPPNPSASGSSSHQRHGHASSEKPVASYPLRGALPSSTTVNGALEGDPLDHPARPSRPAPNNVGHPGTRFAGRPILGRALSDFRMGVRVGQTGAGPAGSRDVRKRRDDVSSILSRSHTEGSPRKASAQR